MMQPMLAAEKTKLANKAAKEAIEQTEKARIAEQNRLTAEKLRRKRSLDHLAKLLQYCSKFCLLRSPQTVFLGYKKPSKPLLKTIQI